MDKETAKQEVEKIVKRFQVIPKGRRIFKKRGEK